MNGGRYGGYFSYQFALIPPYVKTIYAL